MGGSPDEIIEQKRGNNHGVLEIKCPFNNAKNNTIKEMINEAKNSCLEINNGVIQLKRKHDYYYQVQGLCT